MNTKTLLEVYCELKGWQGGTIHQMHEDFKQMSMREKDTLAKAQAAIAKARVTL